MESRKRSSYLTFPSPFSRRAPYFFYKKSVRGVESVKIKTHSFLSFIILAAVKCRRMMGVRKERVLFLQG